MNSTSLYAAIDLGSNSFHMLVVREAAGSIQTLTRIKRKVRLAAGLNNDNHLSAEAMERGWQCLRLFAERLQDIPQPQIAWLPPQHCVSPSMQVNLSRKRRLSLVVRCRLSAAKKRRG